MVGTALATLAAPILWGTTYVTVTELLPDDRPLLVALLRMLPAGAAMALFGHVINRWRPRGSDWQRISGLALVNFGIFFPLLIVGVYRLPGGVAASFGGLQPLLVALVGRWLDQRPVRAVDIGVGTLALIGVSMVVIRPGAGIDPIGVTAATGANVSFAVGVVLTKRWALDGPRVALTGWQLLLGSVMVAPLALLVEGRPQAMSLTNVAGFAHLSLLATGMAFALWFRGVERLPAAAPPLLGLAAPVTGAALGWLLLAEDLTLVQLAGFAVTAGAITHGAVVVPARRPDEVSDEQHPGCTTLGHDRGDRAHPDHDESGRPPRSRWPRDAGGPRRRARAVAGPS